MTTVLVTVTICRKTGNRLRRIVEPSPEPRADDSERAARILAPRLLREWDEQQATQQASA